jgi:hypothetical protein
MAYATAIAGSTTAVSLLSSASTRNSSASFIRSYAIATMNAIAKASIHSSWMPGIQSSSGPQPASAATPAVAITAAVTPDTRCTKAMKRVRVPSHSPNDFRWNGHSTEPKTWRLTQY